jgi:hypothetical protein
MFPLSRILFLTFAAVGILFVLSGLGAPARAEELPQNLGPVGPHEPILTGVGTKRVLAWYEPDSDGCAVTAVTWNRSDVDGTSTAGMRIRLDPGEIVHFDSAYNIKSLNLQCADDAATLSIVDKGELVAFGMQQAGPPMGANASGF